MIRTDRSQILSAKRDDLENLPAWSLSLIQSSGARSSCLWVTEPNGKVNDSLRSKLVLYVLPRSRSNCTTWHFDNL